MLRLGSADRPCHTQDNPAQTSRSCLQTLPSAVAHPGTLTSRAVERRLVVTAGTGRQPAEHAYKGAWRRSHGMWSRIGDEGTKVSGRVVTALDGCPVPSCEKKEITQSREKLAAFRIRSASAEVASIPQWQTCQHQAQSRTSRRDDVAVASSLHQWATAVKRTVFVGLHP